eukprot:TRINITY_DN604962_c0_g2_i1.p1 TRINITY_DN604962_c0_g2~~TRINITY_DN604962_c0_g2_i1.p1  ORF type:complete len:695 (-),score=157.83 TRINITY_DN604962_c0_g2_i1:293-2377(-)
MFAKTAKPVQNFVRSVISPAGEKLFDKVLIANRGEITCRVIRSCQALGIKTVAVYSEADAEANHVKMADEAVCVGPAASAESYLVMDKIIDAVKQTGADAVHPGYGFLSENQAFATALAENDVAFIGPSNYAIEAMGDKIQSKIVAQAAGVNCIPGDNRVIKDAEEAVVVANQVGYPVMIKASAGGGGKGMRIAYDDAECREGFVLSTEESKASFADDRVFIEKFIEDPRHIEIQLLADKFGNVVPFPERECSVQRRNQKVLEESPSCLLDDETRVAMGEQACALAKEVGYLTAGTVEFLCDKNKNFYFLEMNTRLQVEHPVTEYISGVDLVEQMIRVACGYPLPDELVNGPRPLPIKGWAIESRVYAEDPFRGFLPSTGRLMSYAEPTGTIEEGFRIDTGVTEGSEISMFYDPMICKLITHGKDREEALVKMQKALDTYIIRGVNHNVPFLRDVITAPRFQSGKITTGYIAEEYPEGFSGVTLVGEKRARAAAVAAIMEEMRLNKATTIDGQLRTFVPKVAETMFVTMDADEVFEVTLSHSESGIKAVVGENTFDFQGIDWAVNSPLFSAEVSGVDFDAQLMNRLPEGYALYMDGAFMNCAVRNAKEHEYAQYMVPKPEIDFSKMLVSPMPGTLISIDVEEGDSVEPGQKVCVVEAMKMQNVLVAEKKGIVKKVCAGPGETLACDQLIVEYEN